VRLCLEEKRHVIFIDDEKRHVVQILSMCCHSVLAKTTGHSVLHQQLILNCGSFCKKKKKDLQMLIAD